MFKNRVIQNAGVKAYEELFDEVIMIAMEKGVKFGQLQIVDSVHTIARANLIKDEKRKKEGKASIDAEASWRAKGNKMIASKDDKKHKETEYFYGHKDQVSLNAESGPITSVIPGRANDYDGHKLKELVEKDLNKG